VSATVVALEDEDRGWYDDEGVHELYVTNYIVGECTADACGFPFSEYRNYFIFDLSRVDRRIAGASLRLWLPAGGFTSPTGSEVFQLFDVVTDLEELGQRWGEDIFQDLGTGTSYGAFTVKEEAEYTLLDLPLNAAAVAALNGAEGLFAFGGAVTSLDDLMNDEIIFGESGNQRAFLVLETVPLPGAAWLLASALMFLAERRRRS
jgi:hypothetical protein